MFCANYARLTLSNSTFKSNFGRVASNYLSSIFTVAEVLNCSFDNYENPHKIGNEIISNVEGGIITGNY